MMFGSHLKKAKKLKKKKNLGRMAYCDLQIRASRSSLITVRTPWAHNFCDQLFLKEDDDGIREWGPELKAEMR